MGDPASVSYEYVRLRNQQTPNKPPTPLIVARRCHKIYRALEPFIGQKSSPPLYSEMAAACARIIVPRRKSKDPLLQAAGQAAAMAPAFYSTALAHIPPGCTIQPATARLLATRMAGNADTLAAGIAVTPYSYQPHDEWCLGRIVEVGDRTITIEIQSGYPSGILASVRLYERAVDWWAAATGMRTRAELDTRPLYPLELAGMYVHMHTCRGTTPRYSELACSGTLKAINRALDAARQLPGRACPREFTWECYACPLPRVDCRLAVQSELPRVAQCATGHTGFVPRGQSACTVCRANAWRLSRGMRGDWAPPNIVQRSKTV